MRWARGEFEPFMTLNSKTIFAICLSLLVQTASAEDSAATERGAKVFKKCKACHQIGEGADNRVGPHLNTVFGRPAGSVTDYKYSKAMMQAGAEGLVWTEETLDAFLTRPKSVVAKSKMTFSGLKKPADRAALLSYLKQFSDDPANTPKVEPAAVVIDLDPAILAIEGDPEYGEYLSSDCVTCHKIDGANDGIPSITQWPEADFVVAMQAYKRKLRPHPVMQMMAGRLSDEEIAALAAYFKTLE